MFLYIFKYENKQKVMDAEKKKKTDKMKNNIKGLKTETRSKRHSSRYRVNNFYNH